MNPWSWRSDEEFARQILAGTNPVCIRRVTQFPLTSELDQNIYGDQDSKITKHHIEKNMGTMTVEQVHINFCSCNLISQQKNPMHYYIFPKSQSLAQINCRPYIIDT